jgi:hypothetical protein
MTIQKKGWYFYLICALTVVAFPLALTGLLALKEQWINETLWTEMGKTAAHCWMVLIEIMFISQIFKHDAGYTVVTTTEYNLFKCRESGKEETFMMFADNEEELEKFFDYTRPNKKMFIESAEMTGQSIQMKIFNGANE